MKKITLVILCLSLTLTLFASDIYKSNMLGQKLSSVSKIEQEGYYLEESDNLQTLYYNGSVYLTIVILQDGTNKTVTKTYSSGRTETYEYEDQLLVAESVTGEEETNIKYSYINNRLEFCIVNDSEIFFLRSTEDGALIAVKRGSEIELLSDSYLYQNGAIYNIISNFLVSTGEYEALEDGTFNLVEDGKTYHYSETGLLLSITEGEQVQEYSYEDGKISAIKTTEADGSYKIESYKDSSLLTVDQYTKEGVITSSDNYSSGKLVRTVYKDGRAVADIYYKADNVTVENIKYR